MSHYAQGLWNKYAPTQVQIGLPPEIIDAMVLAGLVEVTDRSDAYKLADAVRSIISAHLKPEIERATAEAVKRKQVEDSSWGHGPR